MTDIADLDKRALAWSNRHAEEGDPFAMLRLAMAHLEGWWGVEKNEAIAQEWFEKRFLILEYQAEAGDTMAMYDLGRAYLEGLGVRKNPKKAKEWNAKWMQAIDAETAEIHREWAVEEKKKAEKRIFLLKQRAEDGDIEAILELAVGYRYGRGVEIDLDESRYWLKELDLTVKKRKKEQDDD